MFKKLLISLCLVTNVYAHEWNDQDLVDLTQQQTDMAEAYLLGKLDLYLLAAYNNPDPTIFEPYMCFYTTIWDEYWEPYVFNIRHYITHGGQWKKRYRPAPYIYVLRQMSLETFGCGNWNYFMPWHPEYYND